MNFDILFYFSIRFRLWQIPASPSHTYQCVNGHIVCQKCRPKTLRCPLCRVQMGRGRCLVADKILSYLQHNSTIKIGHICDSKEKSLEIDERPGQRIAEEMPSENVKSTENLHAKRSTFLPFKLKLKTITFWRDAWNKLKSILKSKIFIRCLNLNFFPALVNFSTWRNRTHQIHDEENRAVAHECRSQATSFGNFTAFQCVRDDFTLLMSER